MMAPDRQRAALVVLLLLAGWRAWELFDDGPPAQEVVGVAPRAKERSTTESTPGKTGTVSVRRTLTEVLAAREVADEGEVRDAFAVRKTAAPSALVSLPATVAVQFVSPSLSPPASSPPPIRPPSVQIIGSWSDDQGVSVFLAGPGGVLQKRVGDLVLGEYRVAQIGPWQLVFRHVASQRDVVIPIPPAAQSQLMAVQPSNP